MTNDNDEPYPKAPYIAYGLMRNMGASQINIYRRKQKTFVVEKTLLRDVTLLDEGGVRLNYEACILELVGRNLHPLKELMSYYKMSFIEPYDPKEHYLTTEAAPYIETIRWKTVWQTEEFYYAFGDFQSNVWLISMSPTEPMPIS